MEYFSPTAIVSIVTLIVVSILAPGWAKVISGIAVFVGLSFVLYAVVRKHIQQWLTQPVSKLATAENIFIEILGILLVMVAAGLLGRYAAEAATQPINDELSKLILGIVIGVCVGLGTGFIIRQAWGRLPGIF